MNYKTSEVNIAKIVEGELGTFLFELSARKLIKIKPGDGEKIQPYGVKTALRLTGIVERELARVEQTRLQRKYGI